MWIVYQFYIENIQIWYHIKLEKQIENYIKLHFYYTKIEMKSTEK
jgi:hypothetical protein